MKIGIPKEIKNNENRVGMTLAVVAALFAEVVNVNKKISLGK